MLILNKHRKKLKQICEIFLKEENDYPELVNAINDLNQIFYEASQIEPESSIVQQAIYLPKGKAIGTLWAAMCVKEIMRTKQFIKGIYKGIKAAQKTFQGEPIHILYAGTGPFATLAIPLTSFFIPEEISFTFLEINPESIRLLHNVISALNVQKYINDVVLCDATEYKHDKSKPIHMIITETMLNALQREPQVAITMNLVPQMLKGGILIPQNIKIEAELLNPKKNMDRMMGNPEYDGKCYHVIDTIFELNKETVYEYCDTFPKIEINIPNNIESGYRELSLFTNIEIFNDIYLTNWQCSLNLPKKVLQLNQEATPIRNISFQYTISENPGFHFEVIV